MTESTFEEPKPGIASLLPDELETPPLTLGQLVWRRFRRHKMAIFGSIALLLIILYAFGGMLVFSEADANRTDTGARLQAPSREHPFGTDTIGRDILARTIYGGQISIIIGLTAMLVELVLGVSIGAASGYFGGKLDSLLMRFTEAVLIIPQIFLLLVMAKYFAQSIPNIKLLGRTFSGSVLVIIFVIGITSWPYLARIVRSQFLSVKENDFILAARATGTSTLRDYLPSYLAQQHCTDYRRCHSERCRRHHPGSVYQLPGIRRTPANRHLGQHVGGRLQLRGISLVAVVLPRCSDCLNRIEH